mgnify:CR=1 FL=1
MKTQKMLDKFTFGKTPACMYLAKILNDLQDNRLNSKVSKILVSYKENLKQLEKANEQNILSVKNLNMNINIMRNNLNINIDNELVSNLVHNIIIGDMKSILRKVKKVRVIENAQKHLKKKVENGKSFTTKDGYVIVAKENDKLLEPKYNITHIQDYITPESLTEKWDKKMKKRNIVIED